MPPPVPPYGSPERDPGVPAPTPPTVIVDDRQPGFAEWVILELLGHRRLAGWLTEQQIAGASFLRLDMPGPNDGPGITQLYSPGSVYAITPTTEEIARAVASRSQPAPVQRWELPAPAPSPELDDECVVGDDGECIHGWHDHGDPEMP